MLNELLDVKLAVKMIDRELEKFPEMSFHQALKEYNMDWFDNQLTEDDLKAIKKAWLDTLL